ncbi:MaoC family dehydratase [Vibrio maerlii]|uniref:MaoC family dehydratase n=1 Tax=Vibrio maerlii TaxID=2231648 RepID=UPI000E3C3C2C|nr:MaoC family dehydratase [Vibrio maerlii]
MKVASLFKHHRESLKLNTEVMQWVSPSLREYLNEAVNKAHSNPLLTWVRDHAKPAVNEEQPVEAPIVMKPAAQELYDYLETQVGEVIHTGDFVHVDQEMINQFGSVTGDMQWIHTNPERAGEESPFKTTIAHGFLTLALLPRLTDSVDPEKPQYPTAKMTVNLGLNQVRFPYPVKSGSNVRAKTTLLKATPIKKGIEIEQEIRVEIEGVRRPGCVAVSVIQLHF